jgi:hypothetical protein
MYKVYCVYIYVRNKLTREEEEGKGMYDTERKSLSRK